MKDIELQSKDEVSKGDKLLFSNDFNSDGLGLRKLKTKKIILIISISVIIITAIVLIIVFTTRSSSNTNKIEEPINNDKDSDKDNIKKKYKKEDFYSSRTISYYELINNLTKENSILYHWNLEKDENNKAIFKNKYQHLYNYSTDLKPVNESIGYHLYVPDNYRIIDTDLSNYYKTINEKKPDHLIYGPSINDKKYATAQSLFSDNIKIGNKDSKNPFSISFNIKREINFGLSNAAELFGFNTEDMKKGLSVTISWGVLYFKAGSYASGYTKNDSFDLGYDENKPETKYLSFRPFYNNRWHHICIVQKLLDENDLLYIKGKKVGDVMGEFFLDGMSRKNFSGGFLENYGNLTVFSFTDDETKISNDNFFIDEMMVFNKSLKKEEIQILYDLIDQEAEKVIPKIAPVDCKIPGKICGPLPTDLCPDSKEKLSAEVKVFHFTNKWTCLGINFNNFLMDRITEFCGENLRIVDINKDEGKLQDWQLQDHYLYSILDVTKYYLPEITPIFTNLTSFSNNVKIESTDLNGNDKKIHKMVNYGYWISTEGMWNVPKFYEKLSNIESVKVSVALTNYFAFFELDEPYINNRKYTITFKNSEPISFVYNDMNIISHAIKINQNGYSPLVAKHYAYVGRWLGTYGSLPLDSWINKKFYIYDDKTNEKIFENEITWAKEKDEIFSGDVVKCPLNGESTLLINFTNIEKKNQENDLYIYIPGIGRSLPFKFSHKSVFNAFYTHMKGFYHQRTGIIHEKPYTNWEFPAHHKGIYVAHHIPNKDHYSRYVYFENGTQYTQLSQFNMIKATCTEEYWEDVYGGHADAGDFDNRPYHLKMIDNLGAVWFFNSKNLKDSQLNIPESGDGSPDLLNEMEWQLEIHYRAQKRFNNGGVSTWIEATSHPVGDERYYVGLQTREDTLNYVEAAGMLALCFQLCEKCDKSHFEKWKQSALWAWEWSKKKENQCKYSFNYTIDNEIYNLTYIEPEVPDTMLAKAALVIYKLTSNETDTFPYIFKNISETKNQDKRFYSGVVKLSTNLINSGALDAFPLVLYKDDERFSMVINNLKKALEKAGNLITSLQENGNYTYRNAYYYDFTHPYYDSLAWGNFNGGPSLEYLVMACHIIPEKKETFLQAISFYYDFNTGCNHLGRSFTTGLGQFYPLRLVSHPFWNFFSKKIYDPLPGITLYTFTGGIERETIYKVHLFKYGGKKEYHNEEGYFYPLSPYLANETLKDSNFTIDYSTMRTLLYQKIPFWRRGSNIELSTVASSEFTVSETILQMAMCTGMLVQHEEKVEQCENKNDCPSIFPTDEQMNKSPKSIEEFKDLLGRWTIP